MNSILTQCVETAEISTISRDQEIFVSLVPSPLTISGTNFVGWVVKACCYVSKHQMFQIVLLTYLLTYSLHGAESFLSS